MYSKPRRCCLGLLASVHSRSRNPKRREMHLRWLRAKCCFEALELAFKNLSSSPTATSRNPQASEFHNTLNSPILVRKINFRICPFNKGSKKVENF